MTRLFMTGEQWDDLNDRLFQGDVEHAAFLYAVGDPLAVIETEFIVGDDVTYGLPYHITLSDDVRPRVIKRAWDACASLVEVHSHRTRRAATFSPTDLDGLGDFVPHVMWRLPGRPYIAVVLAEGSFDALVWTVRHGPPQSLDAVIVDGLRVTPTNRTLTHLEGESR